MEGGRDERESGRETAAAETWSGCESDVRIGKRSARRRWGLQWVSPISQGQRKSFKKPFLDKW